MARILVVEDETSIRNEVTDWLTFEGHEVFSAENGLKGLEAARKHLPELIISDITMPDLDGYGLLQALQEDPYLFAVPFIFLTARADRLNMRQGMELGADDYLTKPFSRAELFSAIHARIDRVEAIKSSTQQEFNQLKSKILRIVGHELKTPLLSVQLVQEVIEHQLGQLSHEDLSDLLQTMRAGTDRLKHVVQQILYLTQIESGLLNSVSLRDSGQVIFIDQLIMSAIDLARTFVYRNKDGPVYYKALNPELAVWGDVDLLRHAMAELLSNALAFTKNDKSVLIREWWAKGYLWIDIMDQGAGMSTLQVEETQQLFVQFERDSKEQQGLGIGLTVAREIVRIHGGELRIDSEMDKGTQVIVKLPLYSKSE